MRNQLNVWTNPWRPSQDWFDLSPVFNLREDEGQQTATFLPACEVEEGKDHFLIRIDVPGMAKDEIKVQIAEGKLHVVAERKSEKSTSSESRVFSERRYGRFERSFDLGEHVDSEKVDAAYEDGVLKISLAKSEKIKPRQIDVRVGDKLNA